MKKIGAQRLIIASNKPEVGISFKDVELIYTSSFEMNQQQTYPGSSFYVGWMRSTLVYNNSLSF